MGDWWRSAPSRRAGRQARRASGAREYFGQRNLGAVFGGAAMISSLGMALGPAVGGWIFDTSGGYGFLYIGSFGAGLPAVAVALAFPPRPAAAHHRPQPA